MNLSNRNDVRDLFIATLRDFLGDRAPEVITEATDPHQDLGLDSPDGLDLACVLSEKFGCVFPDDENPIVDDSRHRYRRIGEAIDAICALLQKEHA